MTARLDRTVSARVFGTDVGGYATGRLDYPPGLFDAIKARLGLLDGTSVFEAGAGRGIATRQPLARGPRRLIAVEPDAHFAPALGE